MTTPNLNQLPPISDFDNAYVLAQQAHEQGFRGSTFADLYVWLKSKLDLLGLSNTAGLPETFPTDGDILSAADAGQWTILGPGTYHQPGYPSIEVAEGTVVFAQFDGTQYSIQREVEMPKNTVKDEVIDNTEAVSGIGVEVYSLPITTVRALPTGAMFLPYDRPDVPNRQLMLIDRNGFSIDVITSGSDKILPDGFLYVVDDRPDISYQGVILLDKNGLCFPQGSGGSGSNINLDNLLTYKHFGEMEGYPVEAVKDTQDYWQLWEDMLAADPNYVSRVAMRDSSFLDLPIWRYDFKPNKPKIKILVIGLAHGWEKNISFGWARFFNQLVNDWKGNDALTFMRQNVHFITVPLMSPDNFVRNPFNNSDRTRSRQNYETKWIDASFVASGDEINITYTQPDFPENELHTFSNYFQERADDIVGKTGVTVIDSTDTDAVRHNAVYRLKTVVSPGNIVLENDITVAGTLSGTLKFCVRVDPERNYPTASWGGFTPRNPTSQPITYYDNKGTKPVSTMENANVVDIILENPDISTVIDLHSGAGDYVTYLDSYNRDKSFDVLNNMFESLFNVETSTPSNTNPMSNVYVSELLGIPASLPEWHSSEPPEVGLMTNEQATELHNWLGNIFYVTSIRNINNKK